ncbi:MAG: hypothetical protein ACRD10_12875 [Terriglobia bacterium]
MNQQPGESRSEAIDHLREEIRREARLLGGRLEGLVRDADFLRARLAELAAGWERQLREITQGPDRDSASQIGEPLPGGAEATLSSDGVPEAPQSEESRRKFQREATRYARLLVSEIELYNRAQVEQGRANRDLYSRLKAQIDRSRRAYESRFRRAITSPRDYFHEELVRSLACDDIALLGPGYSPPPE